MSLQPDPQDPNDDPNAGSALTPAAPEPGDRTADSDEHEAVDPNGEESSGPETPSQPEPPSQPETRSGPESPSRPETPSEPETPSQAAPDQSPAPPAWGAPQAPEAQWPAPPPPPADWSSQPAGSRPPGGDAGQAAPTTSGQWSPPPPAPPAPWEAPPPGAGGTWNSPAPPPPGHGYAPPPAAGYAGPAPTYPPAGYPPPGYQAVGYPVAHQTDSKAVVGLVLAISAWLVCPFFAAIVALVLAGQSNRAITESGGQLEGRSMNTATKVLAWINIVLCVLATIVLLGLLVVIAATDSSLFTEITDPSTEF